MKSIGVRELRQRASEYLKEVQGGRTVEVTAHGQPVARLVPVRHAGRRAQLIEQGRLIPAAGDVLDLGAPLEGTPGVPPASQLLELARSVER